MIATTLAFYLAAQNRDAEELFRKFEKKLDEAKSLALGFRLDPVDKPTMEAEGVPAVEGSIRWKAGDRYVLDLAIREKGPEEKLFAKSDGKLLRVRAGGRTEEAKPVKGMSRFLTAVLARGGASVLRSMEWGAKGAPDPAESLKVSDFAMSEGSMIETKVLSYKLLIGGKTRAKISLWLDAKRLAPIMRKVRIEGEGGKDLPFTEHYGSFSTDEIPDAEFEHGR